jgi:hypothetical protein
VSGFPRDVIVKWQKSLTGGPKFACMSVNERYGVFKCHSLIKYFSISLICAILIFN